LLEEVEHQADIVVMLQHAGAVEIGLRAVFLRRVAPLIVETGIEVHAGGVEPDEEGLAVGLGLLHKGLRLGNDFPGIEVLHPLLSQRASVLALLFADLTEARVLGRVVDVGGDTVEHTTGAELLLVVFDIARVGLGEVLVIALLGLFLSIQVIEVAEELVEAVHSRQMRVTIAEVILAELAGGVAVLLQDLGQARRGRL
jgi:hypothetical protein